MATKKQVTEDQNTPAPPAPPVVVDNANRSYAGGDSAALTGHFVRVIGGEHEGRYAALLQTATVGPDGLPETVVIRTRDDDDMQLVVNYRDLAPAQPGGR